MTSEMNKRSPEGAQSLLSHDQDSRNQRYQRGQRYQRHQFDAVGNSMRTGEILPDDDVAGHQHGADDQRDHQHPDKPCRLPPARDQQAQQDTREQQQERRDQHDLRAVAGEQENALQCQHSEGKVHQAQENRRGPPQPVHPELHDRAFPAELIQPEQNRDRLGLAHQVSPVQLVEIDRSAVLRVRHLVGRHDGQVDIGAILFGMRPDPLVLVGRILAVQPDTPDHPAHRFQRALAADAVNDEDRGSLMSDSWIVGGHD